MMKEVTLGLQQEVLPWGHFPLTALPPSDQVLFPSQLSGRRPPDEAEPVWGIRSSMRYDIPVG
jgi:hypothetical protein